MSAGIAVNCGDCPEKKSGNCDGKDLQCVCFKCPRKLSECIDRKSVV